MKSKLTTLERTLNLDDLCCKFNLLVDLSYNGKTLWTASLIKNGDKNKEPVVSATGHKDSDNALESLHWMAHRKYIKR